MQKNCSLRVVGGGFAFLSDFYVDGWQGWGGAFDGAVADEDALAWLGFAAHAHGAAAGEFHEQAACVAPAPEYVALLFGEMREDAI